MASSSSAGQRKYDVFLSFRGEDTRRNFTCHLHDKLRLKGLHTFMDDRGLENGDPIFEELERAIRDSSFAIIVISKGYASSSWCLEELRMIMELQSNDEMAVVPIFYDVDPSDVRKQEGSFEEPFKRYQGSKNPEKVGEWRDSLIQVANLKGADSRAYKNDTEMIEEIASDILRRSIEMSPIGLTNLVGMNAHMERMNSLLNMESKNEVLMMGIWGMPGVGKTSIAKCFYSKFSNEFPAHWFMENVNEVFGSHGLLYLQKQLLSSLLHEENIRVRSAEHGSNEIKKRLSSQRVFIVLDNVNDVKQLQALAKETSWFGPGSRIIITTRDRGLLKSCGGKSLISYKVDCLEDVDALQMFKQVAFEGLASDGYEKLSIRASLLAGGLPSAIESIGSSLRGRTPEEWDAIICRLEKTPHQNIMKILESSYYDLPKADRRIFLLISCLFNGDNIYRICTLLDDDESQANLAINVLAEKSLVSISANRCITMHDLIEQGGKEMVRRESMNKPQEQIILWDYQDICCALKQNTGIIQNEGIALHVCEVPDDWPLSGNIFKPMSNLKFLKFYKHLLHIKSMLQLVTDIDLHSHELRLFHWDGYPMKTLPSNLRPDCLVELNLRYSNLEQLWGGNPDLRNLMRLDLTRSMNLKELPNLSKAMKLKELRIRGCTRLKLNAEFVRSFYALEIFESSYCYGLKSLLTTIGESTTPQEGCSHICYHRTIHLDLKPLTDLSLRDNINTKLHPHLEGIDDDGKLASTSAHAISLLF